MPITATALTLLVVLLAIYGAVAWLLIGNYKSTGNPGFLLLGAAILVWPIVSSLLSEGALNSSWLPVDWTAGYAVAVLTYGSKVIYGSLILLGLIFLGRAQPRRGFWPTKHASSTPHGESGPRPFAT
jgi:hypothetical protein